MGDPPANLLFLFSDQHAQRVAGCYGDAVVETPNLDRLAARGVTFDNAYTPSPICVPARMSMLTGRYPYEQECWTNDDILSSEFPTWPQALGAAGLHAALIGRMHAMGADQLRGYAEREIGDHSPNWPGVPRHDLGPLAKANDPHRESIERSGVGRSAYQILDEATAGAAVRWLDRWAEGNRTAGKARRFALTVGFMLPHAPYVAEADDYGRFAGRVPAPLLPVPETEHPWLGWWRENRSAGEISAASAQRARIAYYGLVSRLDALIGTVIDALERNNLAENTLIVYASDHGEQIGERGLWWKHTFYDQSSKVPLIMSWPGHFKAGTRSSAVVSLHDAAATMLDAMGAPALPGSHGRSLAGIASGKTATWDDLIFGEYCTDAVPDWTGGMAVQQRMVRKGRWKYIEYNGFAPQLFDLDNDPDEVNDLAASSDHQALRAELAALVRQGWNPDAVAERMRARRINKDFQATWARQAHPTDQIRFEIPPEMNVLEQPGPKEPAQGPVRLDVKQLPPGSEPA
ncbi:MAG: sulfatase-like hydrolase/transferase [Proteobacteria bacterium]|nr:sulfatase-like hydrolase/transferase [Pseudomonadota bacterium]